MAAEWKYDWGGLAQEAAKQPIIRMKHLHAKVKNWGATGFATLEQIDDSKLMNEKYQIKDHVCLLPGTKETF